MRARDALSVVSGTVRVGWLAILLLGLRPAVAVAQVVNPCQTPPSPTFVLNPKAAVMESPDHDTITLGGTAPLVTEYVFRWAATPMVNPLADAGLIQVGRAQLVPIEGTSPTCYRVALTSLFASSLPTNKTLTWTVAAKSACCGESEPTPSESPFGFQGRPRNPSPAKFPPGH
jgi:hypothetical protein